VTINGKIDGILNTIEIDSEIVPFFYGMPDFDENPPPNYIVYDVYEIPIYSGDGKFFSKSYNVTVNIFSDGFNYALLDDVESAFCAAEFVYSGGGQIGSDKVYPYTLQHYKEFKTILEE